jgi:hypothetical protein
MKDHGTVVLHGLFSLAEGVTEDDFTPALAGFYDHLQEKGFVLEYSLARRQPLVEGFGMPLPAFDYYTQVVFPNLEADAACYEYVKRDEEPVHSLHRAMNSKVKPVGQHFFLTKNI